MKIAEPVILVGLSYGGLCAQHFVKMHTQNVRALVLVDSTSEDLNLLNNLDLPVLNGESSDEVWLEKCTSYSLMKQDELSEIINPFLTDKQKQLPDEIQQRLFEFQQKPSLYKAMHSEIKNWVKDAEVIKSLGGINNVPLLVIGRDKEFISESVLKKVYQSGKYNYLNKHGTN